jgi:hypothetical protein
VKAAVVLVLVLAACNADVDQPWQLDHDRIVAVKAEPPRIQPGEQSKLSVLLAFADAPVAERAPDFAMVVSPQSLASAVSVGPDGWVVTAPDADALAAARAELKLDAGAPVPLTVGIAVTWPHPVASPNPNGFGATKTVWLGDSGANPELTGVMINGVEPADDAEIVVPSDPLNKVQLFVEADDKVDIVNWLASCCDVHDFDLHKAYLLVPADKPQEGQLALVLRDDRGGVAWRVWPIRAQQ